MSGSQITTTMPETWEQNSKFILQKINEIDSKLTTICDAITTNKTTIARLEEKLTGQTRLIAGFVTVFAAVVSFITAWFTKAH